MLYFLSYRVLFLCIFGLVHGVGASEEWDCKNNTGTFTLFKGCNISTEITVTQNLQITGNHQNFSTVKGVGNERLFYSFEGGDLTLRFLILRGGNATDGLGGGAVRCSGCGLLKLHDLIITSNRADNAAGLLFQNGQRMEVVNCKILNNIAEKNLVAWQNLERRWHRSLG